MIYMLHETPKQAKTPFVPPTAFPRLALRLRLRRRTSHTRRSSAQPRRAAPAPAPAPRPPVASRQSPSASGEPHVAGAHYTHLDTHTRTPRTRCHTALSTRVRASGARIVRRRSPCLGSGATWMAMRVLIWSGFWLLGMGIGHGPIAYVITGTTWGLVVLHAGRSRGGGGAGRKKKRTGERRTFAARSQKNKKHAHTRRSPFEMAICFPTPPLGPWPSLGPVLDAC
jgi:hypothetical protein